MTTVELPTRTVGIPRATCIAPGSIRSIAEVATQAGLIWSRCAIITGLGRTLAFAVDLASRVEGRKEIFQAGPATVEEAIRLYDRLIAFGADVVIAVGGGRVMDLAKLSSARAKIPLMVVPTSLANDGIASPIASLFDSTGQRQSIGTVIPSAVVIDTEIVRMAPIATLRAGVGDLLSNLTAVLDWQLASARGHEVYEEMAALIAESAALPLLSIGPDAKDFVERLAKGLLLSGVAMGASGTSRPCSGAEHLISHGLDNVLGHRARLHGEQVALGTLIAAAAHGVHLSSLRESFRHHGLPTSPRDLGISRAAVREALRAGPTMRPGRYTVLDELDTRQSEQILSQAFGDDD